MKRILTAILAAALLTLPAAALKAEISPQVGKLDTVLHTGILYGAAPTMALGEAPTRLEAVITVARLTAGEAAIRETAAASPIAAAPHEQPYIAWAQAEGWLPAGWTTLDAPVTTAEFLTLLLGALGEDTASPYLTADRLALFDSLALTETLDENLISTTAHWLTPAIATGFTRGDMAIIACNALGCENADGTPLWELHGLERPDSWMAALDIGEYRIQPDNFPEKWGYEEWLDTGIQAHPSHTKPILAPASLTVDGETIDLGAWGFSFTFDIGTTMWYGKYDAEYVPLLDALAALGCSYTLEEGKIAITTEDFAPAPRELTAAEPDASLYMLAGAYKPGADMLKDVTTINEDGTETPAPVSAYDLPFAITVDGMPFVEYGGRMDPGHNYHNVYRDVRKSYAFAVMDGKLYVMVDALAQSLAHVCDIAFESAEMGDNPWPNIHVEIIE